MQIPINELTLALQTVCDPNASDEDNFEKLCQHLNYSAAEIYEDTKDFLNIGWQKIKNIPNKKDDPRYALAPILKNLRRSKGYTQKETAKMMGYSRRHICGIENKEYPVTSKLLNKYANTFGVSVVELVLALDGE